MYEDLSHPVGCQGDMSSDDECLDCSGDDFGVSQLAAINDFLSKLPTVKVCWGFIVKDGKLCEQG